MHSNINHFIFNSILVRINLFKIISCHRRTRHMQILVRNVSSYIFPLPTSRTILKGNYKMLLDVFHSNMSYRVQSQLGNHFNILKFHLVHPTQILMRKLNFLTLLAKLVACHLIQDKEVSWTCLMNAMIRFIHSGIQINSENKEGIGKTYSYFLVMQVTRCFSGDQASIFS